MDLGGIWNPSLALVMIGAIGIVVPAFSFAKGRARSLLNYPIVIPNSKDVDLRLILGSLLFGIGWGIAGFCPGPSIVALGMGSYKAAIFIVVMLLGTLVFEFGERTLRSRQHKKA